MIPSGALGNGPEPIAKGAEGQRIPPCAERGSLAVSPRMASAELGNIFWARRRKPNAGVGVVCRTARQDSNGCSG
eukprot:14829005-Alexandrium_andersonii.AAC.1